MGRPEDSESSQLLLKIVARAPLAVYKYLSLLPLFLFSIPHTSIGFYQNILGVSQWCALPPASLHHFPKRRGLYNMVCVPSASSSGYLQKPSYYNVMVCASSCASSLFSSKWEIRAINGVRAFLRLFIVLSKNKFGQQHGARSFCASPPFSSMKNMSSPWCALPPAPSQNSTIYSKILAGLRNVLATFVSFRKEQIMSSKCLRFRDSQNITTTLTCRWEESRNSG